jgi:lactoylglutathione lyase/glyoxylase I family protein
LFYKEAVMDSGKLHDDEAENFDLSGARQGGASSDEHIETETNVFSVDALKHAAMQHGGAGLSAGIGAVTVNNADAGDADVFDAPQSTQPATDDDTTDGGDDSLDPDDDLDDDIPAPKKGFFARLFNRNRDAEIDDLSLNDDDLSLDDEPEPAATVPEVTDSGVFELGAASAEPAPEPVQEPVPEPAATVPEVTDSGVFELQASAPPAKAAGGGEWEIGWEPEDEKSVGAGAAAIEAKAPDTPPPVFTKLAHVCLYVDNLARSVEFYGKLGFQKRFVFNRNGNLFGAYLEFGGGNFIELFEDPARAISAAPGRLAHFCLETPDIEAAMESLSARGIGFTPKKLGCDSTYQIWLKDPDGNEFEIHQYTPESSQIVGGTVEADWS